MSVDMSPAAVSGRLRMMGELWELSVKLMNSKPADGRTRTKSRSEALEIRDSIRQVLLQDWDPVGVNDIPECVDEYDSYIARVYRILVGSRSVADLVDLLKRIAVEEMAVSSGGTEKLKSVAAKLLTLKVRLEQD